MMIAVRDSPFGLPRPARGTSWRRTRATRPLDEINAVAGSRTINFENRPRSASVGKVLTPSPDLNPVGFLSRTCTARPRKAVLRPLLDSVYNLDKRVK
jgi:hypothetical protein